METIRTSLQRQIYQYERVHGRQVEARRFANAILKGGILLSYLKGETDEQGNPLPKKRNMGASRKRKRKNPPTKNVAKKRRRSTNETFYNVHIDREDAWDALVMEKKAALQKLLQADEIQEKIEYINSLSFVIKTALRQVAKWQTKTILWAQIERIAEILEMDALVIFALQLMYELNTMCTSVVLRTKDGTIAHGRTMDWPMKELEAITVPVRVYVDNKPIGTCMHWVGCVGMFTVMRSEPPEAETVKMKKLKKLILRLPINGVKTLLREAKDHEVKMSRSKLRKLRLLPLPTNATHLQKLKHVIHSLTWKEVREVVAAGEARVEGRSTRKARPVNQGYSISINYRVQRGDSNVINRAKTIVKDYFNNSLTNSMVLSLNQWLGFGDAGMYDTIHSYVGDKGIVLLSRWIQGSQAASFILRDVLKTCKTYDEALNKLKRTPIFSQVYFTIAGINEGAVIARSHDKVDRIKELTSTTHYLIQPNMDWWGGGTDIMDSRRRTTFMEKVLKSRDMQAMWDKMSNKKRNIVCGTITVYSTLMVPSQNKMAWTIGPGK